MKFRFPALLLTFSIVGAAAVLWARSITVDDSGAADIVITTNVELCPDPKDDPDTPEKEGPSPEDLQNFIEAHQEEVARIWNACPRRLRIRRGEPRKTVRFVFNFSVAEDCDGPPDPEKKRFKVHLGKPPPESGKNADSENLWLENTSRSVAHEIGHRMGLDDEYDPNGGTRENLMGRGSGENFEQVLTYHVMTILFENAGSPDANEERRRGLMKTLLRMKDQSTARKIAADNGITGAEYDAYKDQFAANGTEIQPGRPK
ncbi:MAG TPA: hypothetical protein VFW62_10790 [bacterium]|nr:hypothetical protein [bacterium]